MEIRPDKEQFVTLRAWLVRHGVIGADDEVSSLRFKSDPGGEYIEWVDADGMRNEQFLTDSDWHEAQRLLGQHP